MTPIETLHDGPALAHSKLILAHGAGQGMDSPFMQHIAHAIGAGGIQVVRFNFPYMVKRLESGRQRPPDREPVLQAHWRAVIEQIRSSHPGPLVIGGKSMGGRIASLIADGQQIAGLVCLGYPFHPPGRPERLRTAHLASLAERAQEPTSVSETRLIECRRVVLVRAHRPEQVAGAAVEAAQAEEAYREATARGLSRSAAIKTVAADLEVEGAPQFDEDGLGGG